MVPPDEGGGGYFDQGWEEVFIFFLCFFSSFLSFVVVAQAMGVVLHWSERCVQDVCKMCGVCVCMWDVWCVFVVQAGTNRKRARSVRTRCSFSDTLIFTFSPLLCCTLFFSFLFLSLYRLVSLLTLDHLSLSLPPLILHPSSFILHPSPSPSPSPSNSTNPTIDILTATTHKVNTTQTTKYSY